MYPLKWSVIIFAVLVGQCLCSIGETVVQFCQNATNVKIPPPTCLNSSRPLLILYYLKDDDNTPEASFDFSQNSKSSLAGYSIAVDFSLIVETPKTNESFFKECYYEHDGSDREGPVMLKEYKPSQNKINMNVYENNENISTCKSSPCQTSVVKGSEVRLKCGLLGFDSTAYSSGIVFNWTNPEEKWLPKVSDHRNEGESASVVIFFAEKDNNVTCKIYVPALCGAPNVETINVIITVRPRSGVEVINIPISEDKKKHRVMPLWSIIVVSIVCAAVVLFVFVIWVCNWHKRNQPQSDLTSVQGSTENVELVDKSRTTEQKKEIQI